MSQLREAAIAGNVEDVRRLINEGQDVNYFEADGLNHASNDGNYEIVKLFVENGADLKDGDLDQVKVKVKVFK